MTNCARCGADRSTVGVRFPARRLCKCEKKSACNAKGCTSRANVVEFQKPLVTPNQDAPFTSNENAKLFCYDHASDFWADDIAPPKTTTKAPAEVVVEDALPAKRKRRSGNIDPAWALAAPPRGATSLSPTQCAGCKHVCPLKDRKMHNGTFSICPKCGFDVTVHPDEEA